MFIAIIRFWTWEGHEIAKPGKSPMLCKEYSTAPIAAICNGSTRNKDCVLLSKKLRWVSQGSLKKKHSTFSKPKLEISPVRTFCSCCSGFALQNTAINILVASKKKSLSLVAERVKLRNLTISWQQFKATLTKKAMLHHPSSYTFCNVVLDFWFFCKLFTLFFVSLSSLFITLWS